jgi:hypothetical protein
LSTWHLIASEFPPQPGGVSDYSAQVATGLEAAGEHVRVWSREFGAFTPADLRRVGKLMDAYPSPRRILLQWVPHGFGYRSMNVPFCLWLAGRGDQLQIMVHEPGLGFGEGGPVHNAVALVHRAMAAILVRAADRIWVSTEAWGALLRPLALGRKAPIAWLPVPSNIPVAFGEVPEMHDLGYFGQYDAGSLAQLKPILDAYDVLAMGRGSERVQHPRATSTGDLPPGDLSYAIASCKVMLHLYPDGASGRRGTLMASLAHGKAVVTNQGRNTERILAPPAVEPAAILPAIAHLLANEADRQCAAHRSRELYQTHFALERTIAALCASR